jgi:lipoprotein-anchoring transpeptidase ErfK/SrfK
MPNHTPTSVAIGVATAMLLCAAAVAVAAPAPAGAARESARVGGAQQLAILSHATVARSRPSLGARAITKVKALRPITGSNTVLPVTGHAKDAKGARWSRVLLPGRPNGHSGWVRDREITATTTSLRVVIHLSSRRVLVYRDGRLIRTFSAVVGAPSTPTPSGHFFLEETVKLSASTVGAPYALALSARSNVFQEFAGGPGQVAIHGTDNVGGVLGTAVSHGCVRVASGTVAWLAVNMDPGAPITITS